MRSMHKFGKRQPGTTRHRNEHWMESLGDPSRDGFELAVRTSPMSESDCAKFISRPTRSDALDRRTAVLHCPNLISAGMLGRQRQEISAQND